jgi:hypothetical protein
MPWRDVQLSTSDDLGIRWEQLASHPGFPPGKSPQYQADGSLGWVPEPVRTLWSREKSFAPARNRTPAVQPVAHRYTDWAMLAVFIIRFPNKQAKAVQ